MHSPRPGSFLSGPVRDAALELQDRTGDLVTQRRSAALVMDRRG